MDDDGSAKWLVEIFLQYQEAIDIRKKALGNRHWLKEALESDRERKEKSSDSASVFDAL